MRPFSISTLCLIVLAAVSIAEGASGSGRTDRIDSFRSPTSENGNAFSEQHRSGASLKKYSIESIAIGDVLLAGVRQGANCFYSGSFEVKTDVQPNESIAVKVQSDEKCRFIVKEIVRRRVGPSRDDLAKNSVPTLVALNKRDPVEYVLDGWTWLTSGTFGTMGTIFNSTLIYRDDDGWPEVSGDFTSSDACLPATSWIVNICDNNDATYLEPDSFIWKQMEGDFSFDSNFFGIYNATVANRLPTQACYFAFLGGVVPNDSAADADCILYPFEGEFSYESEIEGLCSGCEVRLDQQWPPLPSAAVIVLAKDLRSLVFPPVIENHNVARGWLAPSRTVSLNHMFPVIMPGRRALLLS